MQGKARQGENITTSINVDNIHIFDEQTGKRLN